MGARHGGTAQLNGCSFYSDMSLQQQTPSHVDLPETDFRYEINALRAFAVLAVLAYHFKLPGVSGGFAGVDVFFVISGYLISAQILDAQARGDFSYKRFYVARLRRIFPALLVVGVVCLIWGWFFYLARDYVRLNRHVVGALAFVSNLVFHGEKGYFDPVADTKALLHTWSLSVEAQFYLFLPLLLALAVRFGQIAQRALIVLATLGFLVWMIYLGAQSPGQGFYLLSCRAGEFLVGAIMALLRHKRVGSTLSNLGGSLALGVLLASLGLIDSSMAWPSAWTLVPVLATAALLSFGAAPMLRPLLNFWPLQRTGDISYSLYLWHWPIWVFANQMSAMYGRELVKTDIVCMLLLSFVLAASSWKFVEQPVRYRRGWWNDRRVAWGAFAALLACFLFGLAVVVTKGVPSRLPAYVQRASEAVNIKTPRNECFRLPDGTRVAPGKFCVFGAAAATPTMMLWGDSHANQYAIAAADAAALMGRSGLIATHGGCAPKPSDQLGLPGPCANFNQEISDYLQSRPSIQTIILGRWWGSGHDLEVTIALVKHLVSIGRQVVLVGPLPVPGFDVPERWSMQQILKGGAIDDMDIPVVGQAKAFDARDRLQVELAGLISDGRVALVDPLQRLCDADRCRLVQEGRSNFRDESHLSHAASLDFTPDFLAAYSKLRSAP
jgi:peptidoglycan/LPS O-acetylase OafA/YrhL